MKDIGLLESKGGEVGEQRRRWSEDRDQAQAPVREVADEEAGAIALALQERARRRRAVDHHCSEREEAERGGQEQVVLQGNGPLGLGAGGDAHRTSIRCGAAWSCPRGALAYRVRRADP